MKTKDLQTGMEITCRLGRAGRTGVEWQKDPITNQEWNPKKIYVQKDHNGNLSIITLQDENWAEASMSDFMVTEEGNGLFLVEDFYLELMNIIE